MPKEKQSFLLREGYLHAGKKESVGSFIKKALSFCFVKSKYILLAADLFFLILIFGDLKLLLNDHQASGVALLTLVWVLFAYINTIYSFLLLKNSEIIVKKTFCQFIIFSIIAAIFYQPFFAANFGAVSYFLSLFLFGAALSINRLAFLSIRKKYRSVIVRNNKIAIIGDNQYFDTLEDYIKKGGFDYQVIDKFEKKNFKLFNDSDTSISLHSLWLKGVNEIYCDLSEYSKEELQQLLIEADKYMIRVKMIPAFMQLFDRKVRIQNIGEIPVISVRTEPLSADRNKILKRLFDIVFSSAVIVFILSWLMPIIWVIIKLESKGPLLFKQKRSGMDNRPFSCFKFRSMVAGNAGADQVQCTKNDARITKVGAFLRKTSLDELPQFFNVLKGTMSVVGPRPHMLSHTDQYRKQIDVYMIRHYVKPGITGLAQVSGSRGETKDVQAMEKRVAHDIDYIENWSFFFDLKIIFLTVWNVIKGEENAY